MNQYQTFKELQELNSELKRIHEMMGLTYTGNILTEAAGDPIRKIVPAIEGALEKMGFSKLEVKAEAGLEKLVSKYETTILNSGKETIIKDLEAISEKLSSNNVLQIASGERALLKFTENPQNFNVMLDLFKATDPVKYSVKAKQVVERVLVNNLDVRAIKVAKNVYRKKGAAAFFEHCKAAGLTNGLERFFMDYNPAAKEIIDTGNPFMKFIAGLTQSRAQTFFRVYKNVFKSQELGLKSLHDKFNKVAGEAKVKIEKGETIEVEMKQMKDILQSVKKTWGKSPEMVYYGTKTTDGWQKLIDKELATKIESDPEGPKKLFDAIMKSSGDTWKPIKTEIAAFFKVWPFRVPGLSKSIPMKYLPFVKTLGNYELERVVNFVVFQDARTWDEMYEALLIRGSKISLLSNTVGRMMIGSYVIPAATATLINITKAALTIVEAGMNLGHDIISSNSGWRFDIVKYNQEGTWGGFGEEWCKEYYSRIPHSFKQILDWKNYTLLDDMGDFGKYIFLGIDDIRTDGIIEHIKTKSQKYQEELVSKLLSEHPELRNPENGGYTEEILKDPNKWLEVTQRVLLENKDHKLPTPAPVPAPVNNIIPGSYEAFKQFCASQNPPLTPDADPDGKNNGIYTVGGTAYEWDGTTFIK